tara:strand:+ start:804 stop:2012 length:1209 start_codon:yes stop_codon:yes gene_type:complete
MAIQDDIMAMLSQVSDAGDQATGRGRLGSEMYGNIAGLLSVDDRKKAMREIDMLGDPMQFGSLDEQMQVDPLTGDRVATIIEKYMADAGDGVPIPSDMLVDDTRAAERMMEVLPSPNTAPLTSVGIEELPISAPQIPVDAGQLPPPLPRPDFDPETAEDLILEEDQGLAGLMAGQMAPIRDSDVEEFGVYRPGMARAMTVMDEMNRSPSTQRPEGMSQAQNEAFTRMMKSQLANEVLPRTGQSPEETFRIFMENDTDAINRIDAQQGGPSGREFERRRGRMTEGGVNEGRALALGSTFIPFAAIPKLAAQVGISAGVVNKFLSAGPAGVKRLESMIRSKLKPIPNKTPGDSQTMRQRVPLTPTRNPLQEKLYQQMQNPGGPTGGLARGGAVRDNIMNTYGRM